MGRDILVRDNARMAGQTPCPVRNVGVIVVLPPEGPSESLQRPRRACGIRPKEAVNLALRLDFRPDALALAFIRNIEICQSMGKRARRTGAPAPIGITHAKIIFTQT